MYNKVEFFNGTTAKPYEVSVEVADGIIYVSDPEQTEKPLDFPFDECHYTKTNTKFIVYLNKKSTTYLLFGIDNPDAHEFKKRIDNNKKGIFHSLMRLHWLGLSSILVGLIAVLYLCSTFLIPAIGLKIITAKQETVLGEKLYSSIVEDEQIDTGLTTLLKQFTDNLTLSKHYPIRVTVINDVKNPMYNAFALPGGHIVVYMSLLDKMNSSDELVALLSHESSHVNFRHSLKSMLSGLSTSVVISILTNGMGEGGAVLANANNFVRMGYSRNLEREADEQGMYLMINNQINPKGMKALMESLQKSHKDVSSSLSFLSSHPLTTERIKNADNFVAKHHITGTINPERERIWKEIKQYMYQ